MSNGLYTGALTIPSRFKSTKQPELRLRALLTEGEAQLHFHRDASGRIGEVLV